MKKRDTCPIVQSHRRLLEAHRLWHQALENYFDPEGFRTNINAAIQSLRNLTFALQNEKRNIPNFDLWYAGWIEKLKQDEIMDWLCEARTKIVHKKDLELYSKATVTVQNYETILTAKMDIPIFISGKMILKFLVEKEMIDVDMKKSGAFAIVERKWVVDNYPEQDLLFIVAHGIGVLYCMIEEVHQLLDIPINNCSVVDSLHNIKLSVNSTPICMEFTKKPMQEKIGLTDYLSRVEKVKRIDVNPNLLLKKHKKLLKKYSIDMSSDPYVMADSIFDFAKEVLTVDKYHAPIIHYQTSDLKWHLEATVFTDRTSKYMFWHNFSEKVRKEDIVSIMFLCESWFGSMEEFQNNGTYPVDQKEHEELLLLDIFTKDLRSKRYYAFFKRPFVGNIKFKETIIDDNIHELSTYIRPVLNVWATSVK